MSSVGGYESNCTSDTLGLLVHWSMFSMKHLWSIGVHSRKIRVKCFQECYLVVGPVVDNN